jgi:hypothetical protein
MMSTGVQCVLRLRPTQLSLSKHYACTCRFTA